MAAAYPWKSGWDQPDPVYSGGYQSHGGHGGYGRQYHQQDYASDFVVPNESGVPPPPPPPPAGRPSVPILPRGENGGGIVPKKPIEPRKAPTQLAGEPVVVPAVIPPTPADQQDFTALRRAVKFLVGSQLSKFLSLSKYFDNNHSEFLSCAHHLIEKIMDVEKEKGADSYKTRKMQESVLTFVNAYMEKYYQRKEKLLKEMGQARKRPSAGHGGSAKKRKRYGKVELAAEPLVKETMFAEDESDDENAVVVLKEEDLNRFPALVEVTPTQVKTDHDPPPPSSSDPDEIQILKAKGEPSELTTPVTTQSPAKQTQTTYSAEPLLFSSQPSRSRSGVKVDYGYDEQEVDGYTDSSMSGQGQEPGSPLNPAS